MENVKIIQIALSEPPAPIAKLMKEIKTLASRYELIEEWEPIHRGFYNSIPEGKKWHWLRSDVIRFEYLSLYDKVLYLDWDVTLHWLPKLNQVTWTNRRDYWAIYNGNNKDLFKSILEKGIERTKNRPKWKPITTSWLIPFIDAAGGEVFPKECLTHKGL